MLYGSRRTYLRKVAVAEFDGVCANTTLVVDPKDEAVLLRAFLPWVMTSERYHAFAIAESKGSVNPYVNWSDIAKFEFDLPSLDEQQRMADLLWSVERHHQSLGVTAVAANEALNQDRARQFAAVATSRRLGDLAATRSGPSFAASDVSVTASPGSVPILGITNTKPDGSLDLTEIGYVSGLGGSVSTVDGSSLILIRTNGNRDRIGNVYLPGAEANGHAVSAFQFLLKVHLPSDREYLYWYLSSPAMQAQMSEAASGTTGLGNLAVKWLNDQPIPWPAADEARAALAARFRQLRSVVVSVQTEQSRLSDVRAAIMGEIFGGAE